MDRQNNKMGRRVIITVLLITMIGLSEAFVCQRRQQQHHQQQKQKEKQKHPQWFSGVRPLHMSSIGGDDMGGGDGNDNRKPPGDGSLDDFLDPMRRESENLKKAREALSEGSLPISYDMNKDDDPSPPTIPGLQAQVPSEETPVDDVTEEDSPSSSSPLDGAAGKLVGAFGAKEETDMLLQTNPYLAVVAKLSPSDLIRKFTASAHPRVQDAVRSTILGLIGNLPKMAFETTTVTTGERLASLMFQLQMTGYMFKNAEYRLSMSQSLGIDVTSNYSPLNEPNSKYLLPGDEDAEYEDDIPLSFGKVSGKIKVSYGNNDDEENDNQTEGLSSNLENTDQTDDNEGTSIGMDPSSKVDENNNKMEIEVDAEAYMSELRDQVQNLRDELNEKRMAKEEAIRKDLLLYIRTLPKQQLDSLTNTMSPDVLKSMKGLVNVVMAGIGEGKIGPDTITEQTGEAMAQLCMWQLVVGYNLRELEVREEMKEALLSGKLDAAPGTSTDNAEDDDDDQNSVDYNAGGFE